MYVHRRRTIAPTRYRRPALADTVSRRFTNRIGMPVSTVPVDGLGFSLKPPKWLREGVKKILGGVEATVPTSGGAVVVSGGKVSYQPNQPPPEQPMQQTLMTMLPIGLGVLAIIMLMRRR